MGNIPLLMWVHLNLRMSVLFTTVQPYSLCNKARQKLSPPYDSYFWLFNKETRFLPDSYDCLTGLLIPERKF